MTTAGTTEDGTGKSNGAAASAHGRGKGVGEQKQIDVMKRNLGTLAERLHPMLVASVTNTSGTEPATITFTAKYYPGSTNSKSRLDVTAKLNIPGGGFSHEVTITDDQLRMFPEGS